MALVDFAINLLILLGLMVWYGFAPGWQIVLLPGFVALAVLASLGPALLITALNVKYRDFRYIIPFIVQFGLYVSPVGFSSAVVPEAVAFLVQPQSHGRRHRWLSLVHSRRREPALHAGLPPQLGCGRGLSLARDRLFQAHRENLRGSDLNMASDVVIRAERLGKKYVIGHQAERERYVALRDVIARKARTLRARVTGHRPRSMDLAGLNDGGILGAART